MHEKYKKYMEISVGKPHGGEKNQEQREVRIIFKRILRKECVEMWNLSSVSNSCKHDNTYSVSVEHEGFLD
jgi:hypothetical protein